MILAPICARRKLTYGHRQLAAGSNSAAKGRIWASIGVLQLAHQSYDLADREFDAVRTILQRELDKTVWRIEKRREQALALIDQQYRQFRAADRR